MSAGSCQWVRQAQRCRSQCTAYTNLVINGISRLSQSCEPKSLSGYMILDLSPLPLNPRPSLSTSLSFSLSTSLSFSLSLCLLLFLSTGVSCFFPYSILKDLIRAPVQMQLVFSVQLCKKQDDLLLHGSRTRNP